MQFSKYSRSIKNHIVTAVLMLCAMMIMVLPALANSSNWSFTSTKDGLEVNGSKNGVFHTLTAGTMTLGGDIWSTNTSPYSVVGWTFYVWKDMPIGVPDQNVCTSSPVYPSTTVNQHVSFSKNCGTQAGATYYLIIKRSASDERIVTGSGTISTP